MSDQDTRLLSQLGQATLTRTRACPKRSTGPHSWAWDEAIEAYRCLDCGAREADDTPRECDFAPQSDADSKPAGWDHDFSTFERLAQSNADTDAPITDSTADAAEEQTACVKWNYGCGADDCKHPTYDIFDANGDNIAREVSLDNAATICGMHGALQRVLKWETTDHEDDEKREYELCGLVNEIYILLNPNEPTAPPDSESDAGATPVGSTNEGGLKQGRQELTPSTENGYSDEVKQAAYKLDPECWISYSGKPRPFKGYMETRRVASLKKASALSGELKS